VRLVWRGRPFPTPPQHRHVLYVSYRSERLKVIDVDRASAVLYFQQTLPKLLLPRPIRMYPTHRWTGADLTLDEIGLPSAVNEVLQDTIHHWLSTFMWAKMPALTDGCEDLELVAATLPALTCGDEGNQSTGGAPEGLVEEEMLTACSFPCLFSDVFRFPHHFLTEGRCWGALERNLAFSIFITLLYKVHIVLYISLFLEMASPFSSFSIFHDFRDRNQSWKNIVSMLLSLNQQGEIIESSGCPAVSAGPALAAQNAKARKVVQQLLQEPILGDSMALRIILEPWRKMRSKARYIAGEAWEKRQRAQEMRNMEHPELPAREFRVVIAASNTLESEFLDEVAALMGRVDPWVHLPHRYRSVKNRACLFRMLSRMQCFVKVCGVAKESGAVWQQHGHRCK
jgi:hypothetical protein